MMNSKALHVILVVVCLVSVLASPSKLSLQTALPSDIITVQMPLQFEQWGFSAEKRSFERKWASLPLTCDQAYYERYRNKGLRASSGSGIFGVPVVTDFDGDGFTELMAIDDYGIIVYGRHPGFYPFEEAFSSLPDHHLFVEDVDKDGKKEIVTLRMLPGKQQFAIWRIEDGRLKKIWEMDRKDISHLAFTLTFGDADNDKEPELIVAGRPWIYLFKRSGGGNWDLSYKIPNLGSVDVVTVADVDSDGKNEILATGAGGKLTIYKSMPDLWNSGELAFPVIWQSEDLASDELRPLEEGIEPGAYTQGLAVADVDGDGKVEILVGTSEFGLLKNEKLKPGEYADHGKIHIYRHLKSNSFKEIWVSKWTSGAHIPAFAVGDVDSDHEPEIVYNGQEVYKFDGSDRSFKVVGQLSSRAQNSVIGKVGILTEPEQATRIILMRGFFHQQDLRPDQTYSTSATFRNVWSEVRNVRIHVRAEDPFLTLENGDQLIPRMKSGEIVDTAPILVKIGKIVPKTEDDDYVQSTVWLDMSADNGFKQSIALYVGIDLSK